jgi:hypothetical protein
MIFKPYFWALAALCVSLGLGACTQFSGTVADHWPHWAGGESAGIPPRPGSPSYQEYIAHRQAEGTAPPPAATGSAPAVQPQAPPVQSSSPAPKADTAAAQGGLY